MSTHSYRCVICDSPTDCAADEHALGCSEGGCYSEGPKIEFCSLACFLDLRDRMGVRTLIAADLRPEWAPRLLP